MRTLHDIVAAALLLSVEERERLVDEVLRSLNKPSAFEVDGAWDVEIARRLQAVGAGKAETIPADVVFAEARKLAR